MANADGSIIVNVDLDDKQAQKELNALTKKIDGLNEKIYQKKQEQMPLVQQAKQLGAELDAAKAKLEYMNSGKEFFTSAQIKNQTAAVQEMQTEWNGVQKQVEKYDTDIQKSTVALERAEEKAGEIQQQLAAAGVNGEKMAAATVKANKGMTKFSLRLREVVRSALVFTIITQALARFREWLGKVVKSNAEASAAIARLKGALLTLAQPLVNIIIPAFTTFVNILTNIVNAIASLLSTLFGSTIDQSKEAAENLYNETDAIEGVGGAAKKASKSLASFDEINKLSGETAGGGSGGKEGEIGPDFSKVNSDWLSDVLGDAAGMVTAALLLGGIALVAIGACTGNLSAVIAGLILLSAGVVIGTDTGVFQSWVEKLGLNNVKEFVAVALMLGGIALVAIGAAVGNIFLVIAGLALIGYVIYQAKESGMMQSWAEKLGLDKAPQYITAALLIGGFALIVIGAISHNILMVLAGIGLLVAGVVVGTESGTIQNWWDALHLPEYAQWITPALIIGGMALLIFAIIMKNIFMLVAGFALVSAGVKFGTESGTFEKWWEILNLPEVSGWVEAALMLGGMALICFGVVMFNIFMIISGFALLQISYKYGTETGTFASWWDTLGLPQVPGWVATALQLGGIALIAFGIFTLNLPLLIAGLALLGVSIVAKGASSSNTIDSEYSKSKWTGAGRDVVAGLNNGLNTMGDNGKKWGKKVAGDIADGLEVHSPSEATRRDGRDLVQGLINGINEYTPQLQTTLLQFSSMVLGQFDQLSLDLLTKQQDTQMQAQTALSLWMETVDNLFLVFFSGLQFRADVWAANLQATLDRMVEAALAAAAAIAAAMSSAGGGSSSGSSNKSTSGKSTRTFSLTSAAESVRIGIPALARGAVIPPNREFMAVLGDQKSGTNIETPLATMVQAFKMAVQETGMGGNSTIIMEVDSQQFAKVVYKANKSESRRIGVRLVEV